MFEQITRFWWLVALRGLVAVLFGIAAFVWPSITLTALVLMFGAYVLVDGVMNLAYAVSSKIEHRVLFAIEGIAGIALGIVTLVWPDSTTIALLALIAAWAIVTGVLEVVAAFALRNAISNEWLLGLAGLASIAFGVILALQPQAGALAMIWVIGTYAIFFGVLLIALGFSLRSLGQRLETPVGNGNPSQGGAAPIRSS
jgi:uncharacterized membrane protein HdeD (DUF308 family)